MSTDEPRPAEAAAEPDYAAEAEAMEELAQAGFQMVHASGPESAPDQLTYARSFGEHTDFVYLALAEGAYSMAVRYPMVINSKNFEEASGEVPPPPVDHAKPGGIVDVIREVLEWPRG